jgi:hypothetical protein
LATGKLNPKLCILSKISSPFAPFAPMKMHFHPWWRTKFMKTPVKFLLSPFAYFACFAVKIPRLSFCVLLCAFVAINSRAPASSTPTAHGLTQRRKDATAQRAEVESGDFLRGGRPRDFPRCGFLLSVVPITAFDFASLRLCAFALKLTAEFTSSKCPHYLHFWFFLAGEIGDAGVLVQRECPFWN